MFVVITKLIRHRFHQKAGILPKIVEELFPTLVSIVSQMLQTSPAASANQEIPVMLHLILKSYKTSIIVNLSSHQQSKESIIPLGQLLFAVINLQIPKEVLPEAEDEQEKSKWWKMKKWAYGILGRLFHRSASFFSLYFYLLSTWQIGSGFLPSF